MVIIPSVNRAALPELADCTLESSEGMSKLLISTMLQDLDWLGYHKKIAGNCEADELAGSSPSVSLAAEWNCMGMSSAGFLRFTTE